MHVAMHASRLLPAATLLLALIAGPAQAATYTFSGTLDAGPLAGTPADTFGGSFTFDAPAATFDGDVALTRFTLAFNGALYTLASAADGTTPSAAFAGGTLLGVDFIAGPASAPPVQLLSDWMLTGTYTLAYDISGQGTAGGFGSYRFAAAPVPEPASVALMLAGLGGVGALARRRRIGR